MDREFIARGVKRCSTGKFALWVSPWIAMLLFGLLSPIVGISPRLLLRGFPLFAIVAAGVSRRLFTAILVVGAFAMCLLAVASTTLAWTP